MDFDESLETMQTLDDVKKMKIWMFQERVKIQEKKDELRELSHELHEEMKALQRDRNALDRKIIAADKRFRDNEIFMAKKQKIIEDAFLQLATDKKILECERLNFEYEKRKLKQKLNTAKTVSIDLSTTEGTVYFRGVNNQLALRKRYKDLMKIYHPDNMCGDSKTLLKIQKEYEELRKQYYDV